MAETPSSTPKPEEPRYSADDLVEHARALLDSNGPRVRGALAGQTSKTFTTAQARELLRTYNRRPVTFAGAQEG